MLNLLFNYPTLIIYLFFITCQSLTRLGLFEHNEKLKNTITIVANIGNIATFFLMVYYSYFTTWWAFIGLINLCIIMSVTFDFLYHVALNAKREKHMSDSMMVVGGR